MPTDHSSRQNISDAIIWGVETAVCAALLLFLFSIFLGPVMEDGGWRSDLIGATAWLLGAFCATIDLRHRRRKRREQPLISP